MDRRAPPPIRGSLFLTHGEDGCDRVARRELEQHCRRCLAPEIASATRCPPQAAKRWQPGVWDLRDAVYRDWQNDYASSRGQSEARELERIENRADACLRLRSKMRAAGDRDIRFTTQAFASPDD